MYFWTAEITLEDDSKVAVIKEAETMADAVVAIRIDHPNYKSLKIGLYVPQELPPW